VIVPAYGAAAYLPDAIGSVQCQSLADWELLIVDDASPDETAAVAAQAAAGDGRIRLLRQDGTQGPAAARNLGLAAARGRYLAFLDADDLWLPTKLQRQVACLGASGAAICYTGYRRVSPDLSRQSRTLGVPPRLDHASLLKNTAIVTSSAMIDSSLTGPVRLPLSKRDDLLLWLGLLRAGHRAVGLTECLTLYRCVPGSYSRRYLRAGASIWRIYRQEEGLSPARASWCFVNYALRAAWKRAAPKRSGRAPPDITP